MKNKILSCLVLTIIIFGYVNDVQAGAQNALRSGLRQTAGTSGRTAGSMRPRRLSTVNESPKTAPFETAEQLNTTAIPETSQPGYWDKVKQSFEDLKQAYYNKTEASEAYLAEKFDQAQPVIIDTLKTGAQKTRDAAVTTKEVTTEFGQHLDKKYISNPDSKIGQYVTEVKKSFEPVTEFIQEAWAKTKEVGSEVKNDVGEFFNILGEKTKTSIPGATINATNLTTQVVGHATQPVQEVIKIAGPTVGKGIDPHFYQKPMQTLLEGKGSSQATQELKEALQTIKETGSKNIENLTPRQKVEIGLQGAKFGRSVITDKKVYDQASRLIEFYDARMTKAGGTQLAEWQNQLTKITGKENATVQDLIHSLEQIREGVATLNTQATLHATESFKKSSEILERAVNSEAINKFIKSNNNPQELIQAFKDLSGTEKLKAVSQGGRVGYESGKFAKKLWQELWQDNKIQDEFWKGLAYKDQQILQAGGQQLVKLQNIKKKITGNENATPQEVRNNLRVKWEEAKGIGHATAGLAVFAALPSVASNMPYHDEEQNLHLDAIAADDEAEFNKFAQQQLTAAVEQVQAESASLPENSSDTALAATPIFDQLVEELHQPLATSATPEIEQPTTWWDSVTAGGSYLADSTNNLINSTVELATANPVATGAIATGATLATGRYLYNKYYKGKPFIPSEPIFIDEQETLNE